eukprot:TRINITY_DN1905_c0_g1_i6.p1 TRINITY_DN1905_c0_g1~~TRINITY_DN1905_c0_g1_i6.p1  ORF type:complete len:226 (+),score=22.37 TRINITY_DN1905_c0_g1_i6:113-790(+)
MEASLNYWVQVMINEDMVHILDVRTAKSLSLVSRFLSNTVKRFIEDNFSFYAERRCSFYQSKSIYSVTSIEQINASIRKVRFSYRFNSEIDFSKNTNITHLEFGFNFCQPFENRLPPNLTYLSFTWHPRYSNSILPSKLTHLEVHNFDIPFSNLPLSLTHLFLSGHFNLPITTLPPNMKAVTFKSYYTEPKFKQPISHLNPNIKFIFETSNFNHVFVKPYIYKPN